MEARWSNGYRVGLDVGGSSLALSSLCCFLGQEALFHPVVSMGTNDHNAGGGGGGG